MSHDTAAEPDQPEILWTPDPEVAAGSMMAVFHRWAQTSVGEEMLDYDSFWQWSVDDLDGFWTRLAEFTDVVFHDHAPHAIAELTLPGRPGTPLPSWFPGATLNYAEHALRPGRGRDADDIAIVFHREDGLRRELTHAQLRTEVAAMRAALVDLGVRRGDRVAALVPNCPEAIVAFLATASLGAIWSSCSPDFGVQAVVDRFAQIEPRVLFVVDGYRYNGKAIDIRPTVAKVRTALPGLGSTVLIPYLDGDAVLEEPAVGWTELLERHAGAELAFEPVPFEHPLWILYSSGTTGLPKGIVHGHGGITLEHLKMLVLHSDLGPGDRFCWFTTTGWMMWNYLVSGLLAGATVVLFDGSPTHPDLDTLWRLASEEQITYLGVSAPFVHACRAAGLTPGDTYDLSRLQTIGSTGAPLSPDGFRWIADSVGEHVQIASVSGGTDLCTAFLAASPDKPVWLGELSCRALGARVAAFDDAGREVVGEVGELVITAPMPSMPVAFWNDDDGSRLREAYFTDFPGVWRHGDWITITDRGTAIIHGRSDSTLNRGGVRMGTAEFYRVVEDHTGVVDSLVVDTSGTAGTEAAGRLLCFVVLADGTSLTEIEPELRARIRSELSPRHVPDAFLPVTAVPRTLNGKKCEVPVKRILAGHDPDTVISRDALAVPEALDQIIDLASRLTKREAVQTIDDTLAHHGSITTSAETVQDDRQADRR